MKNKIKLTRASIKFSFNEIDPIFGTSKKELWFKLTEIDSIKPITIDKALRNILHIKLNEFCDFLNTQIGE